MVLNLPTYISLVEAAQRYQVSAETLTRAVESGMLRAVQINGEIAVADEDVAVVAAQVQAQNEGDELVSLNEAARRLNLDSRIVWQWYKNGWLPEMGRGPHSAIYVSFVRANALSILRDRRGGQGRRLIPRDMDINQALQALS